MIVSHFLLTQGQKSASAMPEQWREGTHWGCCWVVVPPVLETLVECSLPYWVFAKVRDVERLAWTIDDETRNAARAFCAQWPDGPQID